MGRGPELADVQRVPPRRAAAHGRRSARQRGALARDRRLPPVRRRSSTTPRGCPGRGSAMFLHVDNGHATNGCVSLAERSSSALLRRAATRRDDRDPRSNRRCIIRMNLYSTSYDDRCDPRLRRLHRPGDARPGARASRSSSRSRSAPTRSPGSPPRRSTRGSTAPCPRSRRTPRRPPPAQTSSSSASTATRPPRSSRRPARSSSTSRARTGSPTPTSRAPGTARRPARGATACPSSIPPPGA